MFHTNILPPSSVLKGIHNNALLVAWFMLISCLAYSSNLKTKVICSPKTTVNLHQTTRRHDTTLHSCCCENPKSSFCIFLWRPWYYIYRLLLQICFSMTESVISLIIFCFFNGLFECNSIHFDVLRHKSAFYSFHVFCLSKLHSSVTIQKTQKTKDCHGIPQSQGRDSRRNDQHLYMVWDRSAVLEWHPCLPARSFTVPT